MRAIADGATHVAPRESGRQRIIAPRSVRESRRGGRDVIRPNVPGSKRDKLHGTSSRDHEHNTADLRFRSHERLGLTNVPTPPSLRDGVAGPREGAFPHLLKPSDYLISRVCNDRGSRPCDSDSNAPESSTSKLHEPSSGARRCNTGDRRRRC